MSALFWMLVLAHLLGDYPLQTDLLISVKRTWWGLGLHICVHLILLFVLAGPALPAIWLYLVALAAFHYAIDFLKNWLGRIRPHWVNGPYIFDQFLHLLSLIAATFWIRSSFDPPALDLTFCLPLRWTILLIGLSFCTVVWSISERVLSHATPDYQREVVDRRWSRIGVRAMLFALFLWLGEQAGLAVLPFLILPYSTSAFRNRAIVTDVVVALLSALLVFVAI